jgi:hypothetical protein
MLCSAEYLVPPSEKLTHHADMLIIAPALYLKLPLQDSNMAAASREIVQTARHLRKRLERLRTALVSFTTDRGGPAARAVPEVHRTLTPMLHQGWDSPVATPLVDWSLGKMNHEATPVESDWSARLRETLRRTPTTRQVLESTESFAPRTVRMLIQ